MTAIGAARGWLITAALLASSCHDRAPPPPQSRARPASSTATTVHAGPAGEPAPAAGHAAHGVPANGVVPALPASPDGAAEILALDRRIELHAGEPALAILLLLERADVRGRLDDYLEAVRRSADWVARAPRLAAAWQIRAQVLTRVHDVAGARAALDRLRRLGRAPGELEGLAATIDELAGGEGAARAAAYRERMARDYPDAMTLTQWASSLAAAGRSDEALAVMQRVPAAIHDNPAELLSWVLFQWGRIFELRGELATARAFHAAAYARMPTVEIATHLAQATAATAGDPSALVAAALARDRHPALLALAGQLDEAQRGWERYVAALPRAFAGHAARFYLDHHRDPSRALALARLDHAGRDTPEVRALVVEAALAAGEPAAACELAPALARGAPVHQFLAWRAFTACHRSDEAGALAARLGIR